MLRPQQKRQSGCTQSRTVWAELDFPSEQQAEGLLDGARRRGPAGGGSESPLSSQA